MKVKATRDFTVGPWHAVVIPKGAIRDVTPNTEGRFHTHTDSGVFFGICTLGDGWKEIPCA